MDGEEIVEQLLRHIDELIQVPERPIPGDQVVSAPLQRFPLFIEFPGPPIGTG
jgi:hypothetical protein